MMAKKAEKSVSRGKAKGEKGRSQQHKNSPSQTSVKGSAKNTGTGGFGKVAIGKGCLPSVIGVMIIIIAVIIF
jgi:hypothetical protein